MWRVWLVTLMTLSLVAPVSAQTPCHYGWQFDGDAPSPWQGAGLSVSGGQLVQSERPLAYFYADASLLTTLGIDDNLSDGDRLSVNGRLGSAFVTGSESTLTLFAEFTSGVVVTTAVAYDMQQSFALTLDFPAGQTVQQTGFYSDVPLLSHQLIISGVTYQHNDCASAGQPTATYNAELFAFLLVVLIFISLEVNHVARLYALLYFHFGYSILTPDLHQTDGQYQYWLLFFVYLIWRLFRLIPDRFVLED